MYWELRTAPHADLLGSSDDRDALLELAREFILSGFPVTDLYLRAEWDEGEDGQDADLPTVLAGEDLVASAEVLHAERSRRSA